MRQINLNNIKEFTSENVYNNCVAKNMLRINEYKSWKCKEWESMSYIIFELSKPTLIDNIEIGNEYSAFVEVLVSNSNAMPEIIYDSEEEFENEVQCYSKSKSKSISKFNKTIDMSDSSQYIFDYESQFIVKRKLKSWGKTCELDMYWRPNLVVTYLSIIGPLDERLRIKKELDLLVETIEELPQKHCSFCFRSDHTIESCVNCSYCLSVDHKYSECSRHHMKVLSFIKLDTKVSSQLQHIRENYKKCSSKPYFKLPNNYIYPELYKVKKIFAIDVEKSRGLDGSPATSVMIVAKIGGLNVRPVYFSFINNTCKILTPDTHYSGVNLCQVFCGTSPAIAKTTILKILSKGKVYGHSILNDFNSLDITPDELKFNCIEIVDISKIPEHMFGNERLGLADMAFAYLGKKIQKYDLKPRPFRCHNVEIDARTTYKLGVHIEELQYQNQISFKWPRNSSAANWTRVMTHTVLRAVIRVSEKWNTH